MNIPIFSNTIGICSAGLYQKIERYYKYHPSNKDCFLFENIGFILAYLHFKGVLSEKNIRDICQYITTDLTIDHKHDESGYRNILSAAEFYSQCFYEMFTIKKWTLPDKIVYNITRPQTWNDYSKGLPIGEINFLEVIEIWTEILDFIDRILNSQIERIK